MADTVLKQISGVGRPSRRVLQTARALHGPSFALSIGSMVEDAVAVNALAALLDRAMTASTSKDGRLDLKDMAIHVIREIRRNQR